MTKASSRRVKLSETRAAEFFVGGIAGCLSLADQLGLKASTGAFLAMALETALPALPMKGVLVAYKKIGGELPPDLAAKIVAATNKPKRRRR